MCVCVRVCESVCVCVCVLVKVYFISSNYNNLACIWLNYNSLAMSHYNI